MNINELIESYLNGSLSVVEKISALLNYIEKNDCKYHSILQINKAALDESEKLDDYFKKNKKLKGNLHGVPVFIKANIKTNDALATSCGSILFENYLAEENAHIVEWLLNEGVVILGKTNMCEFGNYVSNFSNSGFSSLGLQTFSVFGPDYPVGGSSSGAAVSVAADFCTFSIGTETDGSVVYPAAFNGVYAFKFCPHQISQKGIIGISNFFDSTGFFSKNLNDLKYLVDLQLNNSNDNYKVECVFIEKSSFNSTDRFKSDVLYDLIIHFLRESKINHTEGALIENIDPYYEWMDIVCQTEFKSNFSTLFPIDREVFLARCREELLGHFYTDINEIERSFASDFISEGKYGQAVTELNELKRIKHEFLKEKNTDLIVALTLGPSETASLANLAGLTHLVVPVNTGEKIPAALSIMACSGNENKSFKFAEAFASYLKNQNLLNVVV